MYLIVTKEQYEDTYKEAYPHARMSPDGSEYVLSCTGCLKGTLSRQEALRYIKEKWETEPLVQ